MPYPSVRVLFMSGHVTPDFTQHDMTNHPFELLSKPFRTEQLTRMVRAALDRVPQRTVVSCQLPVVR